MNDWREAFLTQDPTVRFFRGQHTDGAAAWTEQPGSALPETLDGLLHEITTDPLTGALNRAAAEVIVNLFASDEEPHLFFMVDLDGFKAVNGPTMKSQPLKGLGRWEESIINKILTIQDKQNTN